MGGGGPSPTTNSRHGIRRVSISRGSESRAWRIRQAFLIRRSLPERLPRTCNRLWSRSRASWAISRGELPRPRPDTPPPSIGRRTGRICTNGASRRRHDGVRRAPSRSDQGAAAWGSGGAGPELCPEGGDPHVREDLADDGRIVERGDEPQPAATAGTGEDVEIETRRIRAAKVHAPGVPAVRGLASRSRARCRHGPGGRSEAGILPTPFRSVVG
jgi:hypothetical protein